MGKLLILLTFIGSDPGVEPKYREASDLIRRALMEHHQVKEEIKELESVSKRVVNRYTGLTEDELVYAAYAYPLVYGKVTTKPFKNFKFSTFGDFNVRPELEYEFNTHNYSAFIIIVKDF